jgi:hypothetical protein
MLFQNHSQSYITTDGQSASLSWCQAPICDPRPIFPLLSLIICWQLRICWCGAPSLTRSWVCSFQLLLDIVSTDFFRSESHGTHEDIVLSLILRLPQPVGLGSRIYFPQEQGSPVIPPGTVAREAYLNMENEFYSSMIQRSVIICGRNRQAVDTSILFGEWSALWECSIEARSRKLRLRP